MMAAESRLQVFALCEVGCELPEFVGFTRFQAAQDPSLATRGARRGQGLCVYVWGRWVRYASLGKTHATDVWVCLELPGCKSLFLAALYVPLASSSAPWSLVLPSRFLMERKKGGGGGVLNGRLGEEEGGKEERKVCIDHSVVKRHPVPCSIQWQTLALQLHMQPSCRAVTPHISPEI